MTASTPPLKGLIFGAARHDPTVWKDHPFVADVVAHFDNEWGYVDLDFRGQVVPPPTTVEAAHVPPEATRDGPDLYFFGEGECPVPLFEHFPRLRELRLAIEGPVEGDTRTCWSAGLWLRDE